jgi:hypothetical protein
MSVAATAATNATKNAATTHLLLSSLCVCEICFRNNVKVVGGEAAPPPLWWSSQSRALPFIYLINIENQYY